MTCFELIEFLMEYLDNALSVEERARFEEHLAICPECVDYLSGYHSAVELSKMAWSMSQVEEEMPERLVEAILAARPTHS